MLRCDYAWKDGLKCTLSKFSGGDTSVCIPNSRSSPSEHPATIRFPLWLKEMLFTAAGTSATIYGEGIKSHCQMGLSNMHMGRSSASTQVYTYLLWFSVQVPYWQSSAHFEVHFCTPWGRQVRRCKAWSHFNFVCGRRTRKIARYRMAC